jgi:hypothetical protein
MGKEEGEDLQKLSKAPMKDQQAQLQRLEGTAALSTRRSTGKRRKEAETIIISEGSIIH